MKKRKNLFKILLLGIVTFCGTGLLSKKCPGTIGSIAASILCFLIFKFGSSGTLTWMFWSSLIVGCLCSHIFIFKYKTASDPKYIVIDEASGIFLGASIMHYFSVLSFWALLWNLCLFRLFDILKPSPIRNIENLCAKQKNTVAIGVMIDDVLAALLGTSVQLLATKWY
jgi:phosphatidylglycerophosphatase A